MLVSRRIHFYPVFPVFFLLFLKRHRYVPARRDYILYNSNETRRSRPSEYFRLFSFLSPFHFSFFFLYFIRLIDLSLHWHRRSLTFVKIGQ